MPDPLRIASDLSPVLFALGDPDLLVEVLSSSPGGAVLVEASPGLPVVYCNEAFERWAPVGRWPLVGRSLPELFAWTDRAAITAAYREVIHTGRPLHRRSAVQPARMTGETRDRPTPWNVSHYPLRGSSGSRGKVTHVLSLMVDASDPAAIRLRMQEAQRRVLAAFGDVARHLADPTGGEALLASLSEVLLDLVPAARAAFWQYDAKAGTISPLPGAYGFSADELESLRDISCRRADDPLMERVVLQDLALRDDIRPGEPGEGPYRAALGRLGVPDTITIGWRSGGRRFGAVAVYGSRGPTGFSEEDVWVLEAAAAAAALVWEHRQADDAAAAIHEREAAGLRRQIEQHIELERQKTDFLKLASHELRGPLGVVRGYVSMMEDGTLGPVGEQAQPVLPMLRAKLDEMNRLINEMLETARLDDSALQLRLVRLDLREVVHEAVRSLEPLADADHRLVTDTPGSAVPVVGDRSRLCMIVTNLVHNALKYSPGGGEVRVTCRVAGGRAEVVVHDQGVGIAAEDLGRLFTRFGRIVTPETAGIGGTGLGLYLARDLARRHGGDVEVESRPGEGSTFTLRLPVSSEPTVPLSA